MVYRVVLLEIAAHVVALYLECETHIEAVERQLALDDQSLLRLRLDGEVVFQEIARLVLLVLFLVLPDVANDGLPVVVLLAPLHVNGVVDGKVLLAPVFLFCLLVVHLEALATDGGGNLRTIGGLDACHEERQTYLLVIHGGQRQIVLTKDHLPFLNLEVDTVGIAGFGRGHAELYNALLGGRLPVGSLHQRTLPAVDDTLFLDSGIAIVGKNLYHLRQTLVDILRTAVLRVADDAGTHPLRCVTSHQRVAEVLIQLHPQHVRDVVLFAFFVFVFVIVSVLLLSLFQCPAQPLFAANKHAANDDGDDISVESVTEGSAFWKLAQLKV